jgi:hypothetical protein
MVVQKKTLYVKIKLPKALDSLLYVIICQINGYCITTDVNIYKIQILGT